MPFINVKGTSIHYYQHPTDNVNPGSLLFIHGSGGSSEVWHHQMNLDRNIYALDLPGHGQSEGTAMSSIKEAADFVAHFLAEVQLPQPLYLIGHSMGSAIAITCALHYPEILDGIILMGAGQRMKVMPAFLDNLSQGRNDPDFIRMGFSPQAPETIVEERVKAFADVPPPVLYADFSACNNFDVSQEVEKIMLPTLIIVGADDKFIPPKLSQYLSNNIKNNRLEIIPDCGHFLMLEKPEVLNRLILEFIN